MMSEEVMNEKSSVEEELEKIVSAKKYFVSKFINYFKNSTILLENRMVSFRSLINEMLSIYDEIIKAKNEVEKSRLIKAFHYISQELSEYIDNNPIFRSNMYSKNFNEINKIIKDINKKNDKFELNVLHRLVTSLRSLNKNLNQMLFTKSHFHIVLDQEKALSFNDIDIIVNSLINELLYAHSSVYINRKIDLVHQKIKNLSEHEYIEELDKQFLKNMFENKNIYFYVRLDFPQELINHLDLDADKSLISKQKFEEKRIITPDNNVIEHLFPSSKVSYLLYQHIVAADDFKASEILDDNVNRFLEVYQLLSGNKGLMKGNKGLWKYNLNDDWKFGDLFISTNDITTSKSSREEEDIKEFIYLRNSRINNDQTGNDMFLLERAYRLININNQMTQENQLLNAWLGLEHVVALYNKDAIIEKIRQVIPKVVALYYVKQKMNELWLELNRYPDKTEKLDTFIDMCKTKESWKYNKLEFAKKIADKDEVKNLCIALNHDIYIKRNLMELNGLLKKPKQLIAKVETINNNVTNDLNRIYRVRNKIVHSGINIPENIHIITARLLNYNQRLLGTIVHYMKKSNGVTLEEVLNSIVETYDWYIKDGPEKGNLEEIITPRYLYL